MTVGSRFRVACSSLIVLIAVAAALPAQQGVGALYGTVTDTQGTLLPGVTLELTGYGELKIQTSDGLGQFRFLALDPGVWSLQARLDGFSTVDYRTISIDASRSTTIAIELTPAIEEVITVTAESPLLDTRQLSTGTTIRQVELDKLPIGRDVWSVLTQSAGVLVNRVDVGGASGSQQANFRGVGASLTDNDYVLDGMQIVDNTGFNATPTYYDFDQFEEIGVVTGGNDVTKNTPGVAINLVTKRGSNEMRGSARFLLTNDDGYFGALKQADSGFDPADLPEGQDNFIGNSIDRLTDYGFEAGGPAWRDKVWLWGAWSQRDYSVRAGDGEPELRILENAAIKLNAQFSAANSFVASYINGDKRAFGRGAGPGVDRSATANQRGPTGITKIEDTHVFGSNFFLTGAYQYVDGGFSLTAVGGSGPDQPPIPDPGGEFNVDADGSRTNRSTLRASRPYEQLKLDASYFVNTGGLSHEIRFGGRLRETKASSLRSYPGRNLLHYAGNLVGVQNPGLLAAFGLPPERYMDAHLVYAYRKGEGPTRVDTSSVWVQDTLTWSRWTVNIGLRYDHEEGENLPDTVEANGGFPELMPSIEFPGNDAGGFSFASFAPRIGVTYALGEERKTLLRGSLSQFPAPLGHYQIDRTNPVSGQYGVILFVDDPGGFTAFYDEGEQFAVLGGLFGFDPSDPTAVSTTNETDPNLDSELMTELVVGAEHAFLPEFVTGLSLTWRRTDKIYDEPRLFVNQLTGEVVTAGADQYLFDGAVSGELPDGSLYSWDTFAANPLLAANGGTLLTNGDREFNSFSAALTMTKRLSNRWMARGFVNYIFEEQWDVPSSFFDDNDPNRTEASVIDGEGSDFWNSKWQWNLNGMYQVAPERAWGFNVSANLTGRQGFAIKYIRRTFGSDGIGREIVVADNIDDFRYGNIFTADLGLSKEFATTGNTSLTFTIDAFNIFNDGTVDNRVRNLGSGSANFVINAVSPRVYRLGVRINWR